MCFKKLIGKPSTDVCIFVLFLKLKFKAGFERVIAQMFFTVTMIVFVHVVLFCFRVKTGAMQSVATRGGKARNKALFTAEK